MCNQSVTYASCGMGQCDQSKCTTVVTQEDIIQSSTFNPPYVYNLATVLFNPLKQFCGTRVLPHTLYDGVKCVDADDVTCTTLTGLAVCRSVALAKTVDTVIVNVAVTSTVCKSYIITSVSLFVFCGDVRSSKIHFNIASCVSNWHRRSCFESWFKH